MYRAVTVRVSKLEDKIATEVLSQTDTHENSAKQLNLLLFSDTDLLPSSSKDYSVHL